MNRCIEPIFEREEEMYMVDYLLCRFRNDASHDHQANFSSLLDYVCWEGEEEDSPRLLANKSLQTYLYRFSKMPCLSCNNNSFTSRSDLLSLCTHACHNCT